MRSAASSRHPHQYLAVAVLVVAGLVLGACAPAAPGERADGRRQAVRPGRRPQTANLSPIKVGVLDDITGVGAIEGALLRISTDLVVEQTNASGGINGHPLQVIYADPKGDATQALQLGTQLVQQDDVDVLTGGDLQPGMPRLAGPRPQGRPGLRAAQRLRQRAVLHPVLQPLLLPRLPRRPPTGRPTRRLRGQELRRQVGHHLPRLRARPVGPGHGGGGARPQRHRLHREDRRAARRSQCDALRLEDPHRRLRPGAAGQPDRAATWRA